MFDLLDEDFPEDLDETLCDCCSQDRENCVCESEPESESQDADE